MATLNEKNIAFLRKQFGAQADEYVQKAKTMTENEFYEFMVQLAGYQPISGRKTQRPAPTLTDMQTQANALLAQARQQSAMFKDMAEAIQARRVSDLLDKASGMGCPKEDALTMVDALGLDAVEAAVNMLNGQKASKGYYISPVFGAVKSIDTADLATYAQRIAAQQSGRDSFFD